MIHEPMLYASARCGCWCFCTCGWGSGVYTTVTGAHIAFGTVHLVAIEQARQFRDVQVMA